MMTTDPATLMSPPKLRPKRDGDGHWAVFLWRLPTGSSTPRVTVWRQLQRLGGATLTPGAALLPWREDLVEQLDWLAQDVDDQGGDAWIFRVTDLADAERRRAVDEVNRERATEYSAIRLDAEAFLGRSPGARNPEDDPGRRQALERQLLALQRRFRKVRDRDHYGASGRIEAATAVDRCLLQARGMKSKPTPNIASHHEAGD